MEGITYFRGHVSLGSSWRWDFLTHPLCFTASAFVRSAAVSYFVEHPSTGVSLRSSSWLDWGHGLGEAAEPTSRSHRIPPGHPVSVPPHCEVGLELLGRGFVPFLRQKLLSWPLFHPVDPAWPVSLLRPGLSLWADGHWSVLGLGRQALAVPPPPPHPVGLRPARSTSLLPGLPCVFPAPVRGESFFISVTGES